MVDYGEFVPEALAASSDIHFNTLASKLDSPPQTDQEWMGHEACIDRLMTGDYAHLDFYPYLQNLYNILGHSRKIHSLRDKIYEANLAFFFQKGTPWVYKYNQGIQRILEANLVDKWFSDILRTQKGKIMRVRWNTYTNKDGKLIKFQFRFSI